MPVERRHRLLREIACIIANSNRPGVVLFAAAIEKSAQIHGEDAVAQATEQILSRFDRFLARRAEQGDKQRGLVVFAEGRFHKRARIWVRDFRQLGTQWGVLRNLSDIPYFASPNETRLLQLADFIAHSVFLLYERRDASLIRSFIHRFDQKDGTLHGLRHFRAPAGVNPCECPACFNWKHPGSFGPWLEPAAMDSGEMR